MQCCWGLSWWPILDTVPSERQSSEAGVLHSRTAWTLRVICPDAECPVLATGGNWFFWELSHCREAGHQVLFNHSLLKFTDIYNARGPCPHMVWLASLFFPKARGCLLLEHWMSAVYTDLLMPFTRCDKHNLQSALTHTQWQREHLSHCCGWHGYRDCAEILPVLKAAWARFSGRHARPKAAGTLNLHRNKHLPVTCVAQWSLSFWCWAYFI